MAPAPAAAPAKTWKDVLVIEGLADSYYQWNITHDGSSRTGPNAVATEGAPAFRAFDTQANSFALNYAKLGFGASFDNVAFRADFGYGHTGSIINGGSPDSLAFLMQQAYASLTLGQLTLDFGKFVTTAGSEVIEANKNWLYSRSLLFNQIPFLHTGVRANFKASDALSLQASIVNGWNNDPDNNEGKTFGLSANITPTPMFNAVVTAYLGKEAAMGDDYRFLLDVVAGLTLSETLALNLNVDFIKEGDVTLFGAALMARMALQEHFALALRGEIMNLDFGIDGVDATQIYEGTVGAIFPFAGHYELRAEVRLDAASEEAFFNGTEAKKMQATGTVAALAFF